MKQQTKLLTILLDSEIQGIYSPPTLTLEQKRINFLLNGIEMEVFASFKDRHIKTYFIILLGYFKIKPIVLNFNFSDIKDDFYFAVAEYLPSISLGPRNLTPLQKSRIYRHIFTLTGFMPITQDSLIKQSSDYSKNIE